MITKLFEILKRIFERIAEVFVRKALVVIRGRVAASLDKQIGELEGVLLNWEITLPIVGKVAVGEEVWEAVEPEMAGLKEAILGEFDQASSG